MGPSIPNVLTQDLPDPIEFINEADVIIRDPAVVPGTVAIDTDLGLLQFTSDGDASTITAIGGYLAGDGLVARKTWSGTADASSKLIGTQVVGAGDDLAFTPGSFRGIALRARQAIDLYIDGELVARGATLVRYATDHGVFEQNTLRPTFERPWPQFRFDTANTGSPDPTGSPPTDSFGEEWSIETNVFVSSPAVSDGIIYVGSTDNNVYALDAATGETVWDDPFQTGGRVISSPAVADDTVYVGSNDGNVYALDAETGETVWDDPFQTRSRVTNSPAVADGTVYVGSTDNNVYALNAATGDVVWDEPIQTTGPVESSPAVADGIVYIGSFEGQVYALDAATGELVWDQPFQTEDAVISSPAVVNGTVYVGSDDTNVYALDAASGEQLWGFKTDDRVNSSPAVVNGTVYVGSDDTNVYALDAASGEQLWRFETDEKVASSPAVADGTIYVGSDDNVYALDAASGEEQGRFEAGGTISTSPAIADGTIYIGSGDPNRAVYALAESEEDIADASLTVTTPFLPPTLDPVDQSRFTAIDQAYEPLLEFEDGELVAHLATDWDRVDETTVELQLRDDVIFHGGEPMTAQDVAFSIERAADPDESVMSNRIEAVEQAVAVDDHTVRIDLTEVAPAILRHLAATVRVQRQAWVKSRDRSALKTAIEGTGPYRLASYSEGEHVEYDRFDEYWGDMPDVERVRFEASNEGRMRVDQLEAGDTDLVVDVPLAEVDRVEAVGDARIAVTPSTSMTFLVMPNDDPPFDSREFRRAMNYAVDVDTIVKDLRRGFATATSQPTLERHVGHAADVDPYPYDPDRATELVAESGHAGAEITLHTHSQDVEVAEAYVAAINGLDNVSADLQVHNFAELVDDIADGDMATSPDVFQIGWNNDIFDGFSTLNPWFGSGQLNHFEDPELEALLEDASSKLDQNKRADLLVRANTRVHDEAAWVFLYQDWDVYGVADRFEWTSRLDGRVLVKDINVNGESDGEDSASES